MKRWLVRICVVLLLGAIVNVAVAWGCCLAIPRTLLPTTGWKAFGESPNGVIWQVAFATGIGTKVMVIVVHHESSPIQPVRQERDRDFAEVVPLWPGLAASFAKDERSSRFGDFVMYRGSGWPCYSLWHRSDFYRGSANDEPPIWLRGLRVGLTAQQILWAEYEPALPLHPIWPGFAINTVFYALMLWLLFAAPFALRRLRGGRRIKRGLCPKCAYPVGTNEVCTECGAAVADRSRAIA